MPDRTPEEVDDLAVQSRFGGALGAGDQFHSDRWTPAIQFGLRRHVEVWKTLRRYLLEDYYPLGEEQPRSLENWSGWQFYDPVDQSGFIQTFRTETPSGTHGFVLYGLDKQAVYRFTDAYSAEGFEVTGSQAMAGGIEITQKILSSRVFAYRKIAR